MLLIQKAITPTLPSISGLSCDHGWELNGKMSFSVIGIGEVLWDLLPSGPQLGGAPANFAFHARQLGAEVQVITRVGNDDFGRQVLRRFSGMDIDVSTVQINQKLPTRNGKVNFGADGTP